MYRIRKSPNGAISASSGGKTGGIILIIGGIIFSLLWIGYIFYGPSKSYESSDLIRSLFGFLFIFLGILKYKRELKANKAKKLKENGGGILKKLTITSIEHYETSGDDNSKGFSGYYAEAREGGMIYCSDAYSKGRRGGTPTFILKEIYHSYGYEYDENETHKQDVLKEYDKRTAERQFDAENGGFFKKLAAKGGLFLTKGQREIIEKGYEPPYREINGNRITVGDTVDIYIDPDDEKNYWMDIDFLFDK